MNNAEEILENIEDSQYLNLKTVAIKAMQAHTNQTLQELKAKVEEEAEINLSGLPKTWVRKDQIIKLIDEAINE